MRKFDKRRESAKNSDRNCKDTNQNFKENIRRNLNKIMMSNDDKSKIIKIFQKEKLIAEDKNVLTSILSKLSVEDSIELLGKNLEQNPKFNQCLNQTALNFERKSKMTDKGIKYSFPLRLSENSLREKVRIWNLKLLSDYEKKYKNRDSVLQWRCNECNHEFEDSIGCLRGYKYPCPMCRKRKRERRTPFYDESKRVKECSHCHQILPYSDFNRRSGKRGKDEGYKKYLAVCKKCNIAVRAVRRYKKKFRFIHEKFGGKCSKCGLSLI